MTQASIVKSVVLYGRLVRLGTVTYEPYPGKNRLPVAPPADRDGDAAFAFPAVETIRVLPPPPTAASFFVKGNAYCVRSAAVPDAPRTRRVSAVMGPADTLPTLARPVILADPAVTVWDVTVLLVTLLRLLM